MATIETILFDLGNVLIDIEEERIERSYRSLLGSDQYEHAARYCADQDLFNRYEVGALDERAFLEELSNAAPGQLSRKELLNAWNSMLIGFPTHRLQMLEQLQQKYPLYVLSNTNETHLRWILRHLDQVHGVGDFAKRYFRKAYYSHLIEARKPDAQAFEIVIEDAGFNPSATLFIDDKEENIETARELGFQTHWHRDGRDVNEVLKEWGLLS